MWKIMQMEEDVIHLGNRANYARVFSPVSLPEEPMSHECHNKQTKKIDFLLKFDFNADLGPKNGCMINKW